jgi:hypothetical protein
MKKQKSYAQNLAETDSSFEIISAEIDILLDESGNPLAVSYGALAAAIEACYNCAPSTFHANRLIMTLVTMKFDEIVESFEEDAKESN